jgi:hypothetical protein
MARALERWEWGNEIEEFLQSLTSSENEIEREGITRSGLG